MKMTGVKTIIPPGPKGTLKAVTHRANTNEICLRKITATPTVLRKYYESGKCMHAHTHAHKHTRLCTLKKFGG